jgi:hypothetical protein
MRSYAELIAPEWNRGKLIFNLRPARLLLLALPSRVRVRLCVVLWTSELCRHCVTIFHFNEALGYLLESDQLVQRLLLQPISPQTQGGIDESIHPKRKVPN